MAPVPDSLESTTVRPAVSVVDETLIAAVVPVAVDVNVLPLRSRTTPVVPTESWLRVMSLRSVYVPAFVALNAASR